MAEGRRCPMKQISYICKNCKQYRTAADGEPYCWIGFTIWDYDSSVCGEYENNEENA